MFEKSTAVFLYCVSPVHMGAGSATGVIDNPIQRERHSNHPSFAGSGIKGAARHAFANLLGEDAQSGPFQQSVNRLFGPPSQGSDLHAGAISFGDAQLVAFPVRSMKRGYVYATCPLALARAQRLLGSVGHTVQWAVPPCEEDNCVVIDHQLLTGGNLNLELFQFAEAQGKGGLKDIADSLAALAFPAQKPDFKFFADKLRSDLVLLSDTDFQYFVDNATLVEAHVRIKDETGAADSGGLFYTENLPPESLLIAPLMASKARTGEEAAAFSAQNMLSQMHNALDGKMLQIGGDATTGRGQVVLKVLEAKP